MGADSDVPREGVVSQHVLLAIDPGLRGCGAALFSDGLLVAAAYVPSTHTEDAMARACRETAQAVQEWCCKVDMLHLPNALVLEWPTTYGGRASRGDARDLLSLAGVDGAIAAFFPGARVDCVEPHAWKGSVTKPKRAADPYPIEARARERLSAEESARVEWPGSAKHRWDVADGVALGLYHLGRFERRRIIHR